jgi:hypothetical protein
VRHRSFAHRGGVHVERRGRAPRPRRAHPFPPSPEAGGV